MADLGWQHHAIGDHEYHFHWTDDGAHDATYTLEVTRNLIGSAIIEAAHNENYSFGQDHAMTTIREARQKVVDRLKDQYHWDCIVGTFARHGNPPECSISSLFALKLASVKRNFLGPLAGEIAKRGNDALIGQTICGTKIVKIDRTQTEPLKAVESKKSAA